MVVLAAAVGCGKKGDPLPPLRKNPQPPTALTIAQRGELLQVSCAAPRLTLDGARLGVMDIELLRADGEGDFRQLAGLAEQIKAAPGETLVFDEVKPEPGSLVRFSVSARSGKHGSAPAGPISYSVREIPPAPTALLAELEPGCVEISWTEALASTLEAPLPPAAAPEPPVSPGAGKRDAAPEPSAADAPRRSPGPPDRAKREETRPRVTEERETGDDEAARQQVQDPRREGERQDRGSAEAPSAEAALEPTPEPTPRPTPPAVGVLIYRRFADEDFGPSLNQAPLETASFVDTEAPLEAELCYTARTVVSLQPFVESGDSEEACLFFRDIAPPEIVVGVTLLRQPEGIEVIWSGSQTADLAGYRVYRAHRGEPAALLVELPPATLHYVDADPPPAAVLEYTITAVDSAGNESEPSDFERIRTR